MIARIYFSVGVVLVLFAVGIDFPWYGWFGLGLICSPIAGALSAIQGE
jgi:hypothetical protein